MEKVLVERFRQLSLRIRQQLPMYGATILFNNLSTERSVTCLLHPLAAVFAQRDERLLVIDTRVADDGIGELGDWIAPDHLAACAIGDRQPSLVASETPEPETALTGESMFTAISRVFDRPTEESCLYPQAEQILPGLTDYLERNVEDARHILHPTNLPGVDCVLPGASRQTERFSTTRMSQLMTELREQYSLVVLIDQRWHSKPILRFFPHMRTES